MAPETLKDPFLSTKASDVWMFGAMMVEVLAPLLPGTYRNTWLKQLSGEFVRDGLVSQCPKRLQDVISSCLRLQPGERPVMRNLLVKLHNILHQGARKLGDPAWV